MLKIPVWRCYIDTLAGFGKPHKCVVTTQMNFVYYYQLRMICQYFFHNYHFLNKNVTTYNIIENRICAMKVFFYYRQ